MLMTLAAAFAAVAAQAGGEDPLQCMIDRTPAQFRVQFAERIETKLDPRIDGLIPKSFENEINNCIPETWTEAEAESLGGSWAAAELRIAAETVLSRRHGIDASALDSAWASLSDADYSALLDSVGANQPSAEEQLVLRRFAGALSPRLRGTAALPAGSEDEHLLKIIALYVFARANSESSSMSVPVEELSAGE